jgi:hypothetical protein
MLLKACIKSAKERISSDFVGGYSLTNTAPPPCGAGGKAASRQRAVLNLWVRFLDPPRLMGAGAE